MGCGDIDTFFPNSGPGMEAGGKFYAVAYLPPKRVVSFG
jgi:hypothetical protein